MGELLITERKDYFDNNNRIIKSTWDDGLGVEHIWRYRKNTYLFCIKSPYYTHFVIYDNGGNIKNKKTFYKSII
jgi:hypothetical protein